MNAEMLELSVIDALTMGVRREKFVQCKNQVVRHTEVSVRDKVKASILIIDFQAENADLQFSISQNPSLIPAM